MANEYTSLGNNSDFLVQARAATVFAAHESSLFLGGSLIPVVNAPNGLLKVPVMSGGAAQVIGTETDADLTVQAMTTSGSVNIVCDLYGARNVVRDLGAIDAGEVGRQLGNKVSAAFDASVAGQLGLLTQQEITDSAGLTVDEVAKAVAGIRGAGETGQLFGIISTNAYAALMADIGGNAFAGGEMFQGQALRSGFFGQIMGVNMFVSSYLNDTNSGETATKAAIFSQDALRIAMQKNLDLEIARRAEAVGNDVVASLHAGVGVVDATRGRLLIDQA